MKKLAVVLGLGLLGVFPVFPREQVRTCGTYAGNWQDQIHLHRTAEAERKRSPSGRTLQPRPASIDIGNLVILEGDDATIARPSLFNLDRKTVTFRRTAAGLYRFELSGDTYDQQASASGTRLELTDDDTRSVSLPFSFPFYGLTHTTVFVNSDGNLTLGSGDDSFNERTLGRLTAGPPRIAALFRDLDPPLSSDGVRILSAPDRFVVTWAAVPEYRDFGTGPRQSFQIRLYPDGRVDLAYQGASPTAAVVGIAPGQLHRESKVVSFTSTPTQEYAGAVAERFGTTQEIDMVSAAQRFYENHDDAYDYLVVYNSLGISASATALAWELTVRNDRTGFGDHILDVGRDFGSRRRLQAVLNMGPLSQYPSDPNAIVSARGTTGDTPLSILGHEAGHLFLALASIRNPDNPSARPMLSRDLAHWNFTFNADASLLDGNRIRDDGPGTSPRFTTTATVQGYSALDQYLMGLRPPEEVPPTFLVQNSPEISPARTSPQSGVSFNGQRRDVLVEEIIAAEGRRTPDHTVAQRRFRLGFILLVPQGSTPSVADIQKVEGFRREFEAYFSRVTSGRASADTRLLRNLHLSVFPASGVLAGATVPVSLILDAPAPEDVRVQLRTQSGNLAVPDSVTIPAGSATAAFEIRGLRSGVDELIAEPADSRFLDTRVKIQVSQAESIKLAVVAGNRQKATPGSPLPLPIEIKVTDTNNLPYPGNRVRAAVTAGGRLDQEVAITDDAGIARFQWTPGSADDDLRATLENMPGAAVTATLQTPPAVASGGVLNGASFRPRLAPGAFGTIFGSGLSAGVTASSNALPEILANVQVFLNNRPAPMYYVSPRQINFIIPSDMSTGDANLVVVNPDGPSPTVPVTIAAAAPGIFFDPASGTGAIRQVENALEVYATGLGNAPTGVVAIVNGVRTDPLFAGRSAIPGLDQVNVRIPAGGGLLTLALEADGIRSNDVTFNVR